jgi:hypothetical protein
LYEVGLSPVILSLFEFHEFLKHMGGCTSS